MTDTFFVLQDGTATSRTYLATDHTRGPWDPRAQHGGPPSALIGQTLDQLHRRDDAQFVRFTMEILRPVPVERLTVDTRIERGGRKVELLAADLLDASGNVVMTARAWRIRLAEIHLTEGLDDTGIEGTRVEGPAQASASTSFFKPIEHEGYVQAVETRFVSGGWASPGASVAWLRMRYPLVEGEPTSPVARALIAADSGNGVSARFEGVFINPDLSVYLTRLPIGKWVCLDAATTLTNHGIGLSTSVLHDQTGPIGRGTQSLLLERG